MCLIQVGSMQVQRGDKRRGGGGGGVGGMFRVETNTQAVFGDVRYSFNSLLSEMTN